MRVVVSDARQAAAADAAAIAAGIPSRALMQRAGAAAAAEISARYGGEIGRGVVIATGAGNNGGDGWVIARALHAVGARVRVVQCADARTNDARAEQALAIADGVHVDHGSAALLNGSEVIVVDALLGTGFSAVTPLRSDVATAVAGLVDLSKRGARIVSIDLPSGMDATTGAVQGELHASLTLTFGTLKRGLLRARAHAGEIVLLDIGLGAHANQTGTPSLATATWFRAALPAIAADSHKGTRKKIAIIGGAKGMAGAVILAARAALRSGAGLVKCIVDVDSVLALQKAEPAALAAAWPAENAWTDLLGDWPDAVLIGPGLGANARELIESVLRSFKGPVVLDADALNAFARDAAAFAPYLQDREALLTPHPLEFMRLAGIHPPATTASITAEMHADLASGTGGTVLLKGVPTTIIAPHGESIVVAEGTPILATGGSGDVLGGIATTLLAQCGSAITAGSLAAFAHGRAAASLAQNQVRGFTVEDVIDALPKIWSLHPSSPRAPVLVELPAVGDQR